MIEYLEGQRFSATSLTAGLSDEMVRKGSNVKKCMIPNCSQEV